MNINSFSEVLRSKMESANKLGRPDPTLQDPRYLAFLLGNTIVEPPVRKKLGTAYHIEAIKRRSTQPDERQEVRILVKDISVEHQILFVQFLRLCKGSIEPDTFTEREIVRAFRQAAKRFHPDSGDTANREKFELAHFIYKELRALFFQQNAKAGA